MTPGNLVPSPSPSPSVTRIATVTRSTRTSTSRDISLIARSADARERSLQATGNRQPATDHFPREPLFISLPRAIANHRGQSRTPLAAERAQSTEDPPRGKGAAIQTGKRSESDGDEAAEAWVAQEEGRTESLVAAPAPAAEEKEAAEEEEVEEEQEDEERERAGSSSDTIPDRAAHAPAHRLLSRANSNRISPFNRGGARAISNAPWDNPQHRFHSNHVCFSSLLQRARWINLR